MSNLGGLEILTIMIIALIVLGPTKLPEAARQVGRVVNELRKVSGGFQREMREAMNETLEAEARARGEQHTPPTARPVPPASSPTPIESTSAAGADAAPSPDGKPEAGSADAESTDPAAHPDG
jgi:Tat protein translocase TatB subunit